MRTRNFGFRSSGSREPWQVFEQQGVGCAQGSGLAANWGVDGRSPGERQLEGPGVTVTSLKEGESHWRRKTPGDTQPTSEQPRVLRKAAAGTT